MSFHVNTSVRSCVFWKKKKTMLLWLQKGKESIQYTATAMPFTSPQFQKKKKTYRELTDNKISVPKASYLMLSAASPEDFQALGTTECNLLQISVTCRSYLWTASENVYNLLSKLMNHPCWTRFPGGITILPLALRAMTWCRIAGRVLHLTVPPNDKTGVELDAGYFILHRTQALMPLRKMNSTLVLFLPSSQISVWLGSFRQEQQQ